MDFLNACILLPLHFLMGIRVSQQTLCSSISLLSDATDQGSSLPDRFQAPLAFLSLPILRVKYSTRFFLSNLGFWSVLQLLIYIRKISSGVA